MHFNLTNSIEILERTPAVLANLLSGLSDSWIFQNEGENTWSPYDVIGHLIHGEKTDWIPRLKIILSDNVDKTFEPYDRFAQFENSKGKTLEQLLTEFSSLRQQNLGFLKNLSLTEDQLDKTGTHPAFGMVTLRELLATWTVHDLTHINQISRVLAKQYDKEVGPWKEYLGVLNQ